MSRFLTAALAAISISGPVLAAAQSATAAPPPKSVVWFARDDEAIDKLDENPAVTRRMVDALVLGVTGQPDTAKAWRSLVSPKDRVGIKVSASGGRNFATHFGVVDAVLDGLERAGIPRKQIILWDRDAAGLRAAGFTSKRLGCDVRAIDPPRGWDRDATFSAPVLGKLIWGDLLFVEKQKHALGQKLTEADQLSSTSHFATIVSRDVTKIINLAVLSDEAGCGVAGALYNVTVPNVDNWRRFVQASGVASDSIPAIYAGERIRAKVVLHIVDGLAAQFAAGPGGDPNYAFAHATIYAGRDPVALDATSLRLMEGWRKEAKLPPIGARGEWLKAAEAAGLGVFAEDRIELRQITPAK